MKIAQDIPIRIARTARETPGAIALECEGKAITYAELSSRAEDILRFATRIIGNPRGQRIGVVLRNSVSAYATLWASLIGGFTFVPLNPMGSLSRNRQLMQRAEVSLVLTDGANLFRVLPLLPDVPTLNVETGKIDRPALNITRTQTDFAYLLFTSGTTGEPKGVPISGRNLKAFVDSIQHLYPLRSGDRVAQTFELTFDLAMYATVVSWTSGATMVSMADMDKFDPVGFIIDAKIDVWFSVPSMISLAHRRGQLTPRSMTRLRLSMFCGEALPSALAAAWGKAFELSKMVNLYGPTEATIACSHHVVDIHENSGHTVPIGCPFDTIKFAMRDSDGNFILTPRPGQEGEILIAGEQVFDGYWRSPDVTARAFTRSRIDQKAYDWYHTGDVVRAEEDGWGYIGRLDDQVQVLGHRVEMGEVEHRLATQLGVHAGSVIVTPVTSEEGIVESLTAFVETEKQVVFRREESALPHYMIPSKFISIDSIPLNANGKVDRKTLKNRAQGAAKC